MTAATPRRGADRKVLVIKASGGWRSVDLREVWRYRNLVLAMVRRDLTLRYRQTALGVAWVVVQPLLAAGIFAFVFGTIARFPSSGVPYVMFAFSGLVGWNAFSTSFSAISISLVNNSQLVSKVYFPRLVLPVAQVGSKIIDVAISLLMYVALALITGIGFHLSLLTLPCWLVLSFALALGAGLFAAALNVAYRDVGYILPVALPFLLYVSPVAYGATQVPHAAQILYEANPLVGVIEGLRWSLLGRGAVGSGAVLWSVVSTMITLVGGAFYFRSHERTFADVI